MTRRLLLLASAACIAGCSQLTAGGEREEAALIRYYGEDAQVILPDSARVGQEITIRVRTFGGGCTRKVSRTVIDRTLGTDLYLYNHSTGGNVCTADLIFIEHQAVLKFDAVGGYVVRIYGTNRGSETRDKTVEWMTSRTVTVRP